MPHTLSSAGARSTLSPILAALARRSPTDRASDRLATLAERALDLSGRSRLVQAGPARSTEIFAASGTCEGLVAALARGRPLRVESARGRDPAAPGATPAALQPAVRGLPVRPARAFRTDLDAATLSVRLERLAGAAGLARRESGVRPLRLAIGTLDWADPEADRVRASPLILAPVALRTDAEGVWRLEPDAGPLAANPALRLRLASLGVSLPALRRGAGVAAWLRDVEREALARDGWSMRRTATLGLFDDPRAAILADLDPTDWAEGRGPDRHPLARRLLGIDECSADGASDRSTRRPACGEPPLVESLDASQVAVVAAALEGRSVAVQGPPGSGKSRTVAAAVAAALAGSRRVLVVGPREEALDVIAERLEGHGLAPFLLRLRAEGSRAALAALAAGGAGSAPEFRPFSPEPARDEAWDRLAERATALSRPSGLGDASLADLCVAAATARLALGRAARAFDALPVVERPRPLDDASEVAAGRRRLAELRRTLRGLGHADPAAHPWSGLCRPSAPPCAARRLAASARDWAASLGRVSEIVEGQAWASAPDEAIEAAAARRRDLETARDAGRRAESALADLETALGFRLPRTSGAIRRALEAARDLAGSPSGRSSCGALAAEGSADGLARLRSELARIEDEAAALRAIFRPAAFSRSPEDLEALASVLAAYGVRARFGVERRSAEAAWRALSRPLAAIRTAEERASAFERLADLARAREALAATLAREFGDAALDLAELDARIAAARAAQAVRDLRKLAGAVGDAPAATRNGVAGRAAGRVLETLEPLSAALALIADPDAAVSLPRLAVEARLPAPCRPIAAAAPCDRRWRAALARLFAAGRATAEARAARRCYETVAGPVQSPSDDRAAFAARLRRAAAQPGRLGAWLAYAAALEACRGGAEAPMLPALLDGRAPLERAEEGFAALALETAAWGGLEAAPASAVAGGEALDAPRRRAVRLDAAAVDRRRDRLRRALAARAGAPEVRAAALRLVAEASRPGGPTARELLAREREALRVLAPCVLATPETVARLLPRRADEFDLVVVDEASQIRPAEATGVVARARAALVVGDERQLPPTPFFERRAAGLGGEVSRDVGESALALATSRLETLALRRHYRARDAALMAFSAGRFYPEGLVGFAAPRTRAERSPIGWTSVPDGAARGGLNRAEARAVAGLVARRLRETPDLDVRVVAMNLRQAAAIRRAMIDLAGEEPVLAARLDAAESGDGPALEVRSLERVQGAEADLVVVSATYGPPTPGGRVPQVFGPVGHETGWRRLNVLASRARRRLDVVASLRAADVAAGPAATQGARAFRDFLDWAERRGAAGSVEVPSTAATTPLAAVVAEGLRARGFETVFGDGRVAGPDLEVLDPGDPGATIAGIVCDDGRLYPRSGLRDALRVVPEGLAERGWILLHTDPVALLADPQAELGRLVAALEVAAEHSRSAPVRLA